MKTHTTVRAGIARLPQFIFVFPVFSALLMVSAGTVQAATLNVSAGDVVNLWTNDNTPITGAGTIGGAVNSGGELMMPDSLSKISNFQINDYSSNGDYTLRTSFIMRHTGDDDAFGVYFNFQDINNHYRIAWDAFDKISQPIGKGDALGTNGVQNKTLAGTPAAVHGLRIVKEVGGVNTFLYQQPGPSGAIGWQRNILYNLEVTRTGNSFHVVVEENGGPVVLDTTFVDASYTNGRIGVFTDSQALGYFTNISLETNPVPEPSTLVMAGLSGLSALAYGWHRRRRKQANSELAA